MKKKPTIAFMYDFDATVCPRNLLISNVDAKQKNEVTE